MSGNVLGHYVGSALIENPVFLVSALRRPVIICMYHHAQNWVVEIGIASIYQ